MCKTMEIEFDQDGNIKRIKMESVKRAEAKDFYAELEKLTGKATTTETRQEYHAVKQGIKSESHTHTH